MHRRDRSGFEEPAVNASVDLLGSRPGPDRDALLDETIDAALALLGG